MKYDYYLDVRLRPIIEVDGDYEFSGSEDGLNDAPILATRVIIVRFHIIWINSFFAEFELQPIYWGSILLWPRFFFDECEFVTSPTIEILYY